MWQGLSSAEKGSLERLLNTVGGFSKWPISDVRTHMGTYLRMYLHTASLCIYVYSIHTCVYVYVYTGIYRYTHKCMYLNPCMRRTYTDHDARSGFVDVRVAAPAGFTRRY